jgi:DNA-3-methyladenine glycosylase
MIPRTFYARPTLQVARGLLGQVLCHDTGERLLRARIVEVEAYVSERDGACHARAGRTARTEVMYGEPGHAYVYLIYGMHEMLNVVTEPRDFPAAVLIRGAELLGEGGAPRPLPGPGRLTSALGIGRHLNRADLCGRALWIEEGTCRRGERVARSPRIGIAYAGAPWVEKPWRFYLAGNPGVSRVIERPPRG